MSAPQTDVRALLREPTPRAARAVALGLLDSVDAERVRLDQPRDRTAVHDFRVSLRRLRSWLRAYEADLADTVGAKARRRLSALARASTDSREIEVHLGWLSAQRQTLVEPEQAGLRWVIRDLRADRRRADAAFRIAVTEGFTEASAGLRKKLSRYAVAVWDQEPHERWATTAAARAQEAFQELRQALGAMGTVDDDEPMHRARIAGKRLRYVLEPLAGTVEGVTDAVALLKNAQDLLGSAHDAFVFAKVLRRMSRRAHKARTRRGADVRPGIRALQVRLDARRSEAWAEFTKRWLGRDFDILAATIHAIIQSLIDAGGTGVEIERKYLLRKVPREVSRAPHAEIQQGYLPGTVLIERLRKVRAPDGIRYYRTVKSGEGVVRTEIEEQCTSAVFRAMWPLTKGRRLTKRRYRLADSGHIWEIDVFLDRRLVLAEIELTSVAEAVPLPDWLSRCLVREVTNEREYVNAVLAR